jgi:hypothetical protein
MWRCALLPAFVAASACVPADDAGQPVYGSVAIALSMSASQIELSDGWSFTLEHLLLVPWVAVGSEGEFAGSSQSATKSCSAPAPDGSGNTVVDLVQATTFNVNRVDTNGGCTDLAIGATPVGSQDIASDPGVSEADRLAYLAGSGTTFPAVLIVGRATRGAEKKRVSLLLGGGEIDRPTYPSAIDIPSFSCTPKKVGTALPLGVANVRQTLHFALDLALLFPGSPPAFDPIAEADSNGDGVVTASEIGACLGTAMAFRIGNGWQLAADDGVCQAQDSGRGVPLPTECNAALDGGSQ